jgi:hypothetical protein
MEKEDDIPVWVFLAFSSIKSRKGALLLIWSCVAFSIYCIPWSLTFTQQEWIQELFLIEDWSWFAMMLPITLWYWSSLRWVDRNSKWQDAT